MQGKNDPAFGIYPKWGNSDVYFDDIHSIFNTQNHTFMLICMNGHSVTFIKDGRCHNFCLSPPVPGTMLRQLTSLETSRLRDVTSLVVIIL